MRVDKVTRPGAQKVKGKKKPDEASKGESISFSEILACTEYDERRDELQKALDEIDQKGRELVENRTVETLYEYKAMIKGFIDEVVEKGFEIKSRRGYSRVGRNKVLKTVSQVDDKLVELTNMILKREHKEINLLKKVGEIQGLLVNLFV